MNRNADPESVTIMEPDFKLAIPGVLPCLNTDGTLKAAAPVFAGSL